MTTKVATTTEVKSYTDVEAFIEQTEQSVLLFKNTLKDIKEFKGMAPTALTFVMDLTLSRLAMQAHELNKIYN